MTCSRHPWTDPDCEECQSAQESGAAPQRSRKEIERERRRLEQSQARADAERVRQKREQPYRPPLVYTPPGWFPDPGGGSCLRWWDGEKWTHHLAAYPPPPPTD